jgi:release factor glutamine methyltransferase
MTEELWTTRRLLHWTTDFLKQRGGDSPRLDAEILLAHARGCDRIDLYTSFDEEIDEVVRARFRELVKQRSNGCPVAYLVGFREFYSLNFEVGPDVLVPRPETEFLVMSVIDWVKAQDVQREWRIVDVGTGSGIVAICLAKYLPNAKIVATDISPAAIEVAKRNAGTHGVIDRIGFLEADLVSPSILARTDILVSNPPYIGESEKENLPKDVVDFEPHLALFGGECGHELTTRLLQLASENLSPLAPVFIEINANLAGTYLETAIRLGWSAAKVLPDLAGQPRVLQATR